MLKSFRPPRRPATVTTGGPGPGRDRTKPTTLTRSATVLGAAGILIAGAAVAHAAIPDTTTGKFYACYATSDSPKPLLSVVVGGALPYYNKGDVRFVQHGETCRSYEAGPVAWNQNLPTAGSTMFALVAMNLDTGALELHQQSGGISLTTIPGGGLPARLQGIEVNFPRDITGCVALAARSSGNDALETISDEHVLQTNVRSPSTVLVIQQSNFANQLSPFAITVQC